MPNDHPIQIVFAESEAERRAACELLTLHLPANLAQQRLVEMEASAAAGLCCLARRGDNAVGAVYALALPGKTCLVWPPRLRPNMAAHDVEAAPIVVALIQAVVQAQASRGVILAQAMLAPSDDAAPFLAAGFERLTELIYLSAACDTPPEKGSSHLEFLAVAPQDLRQFERLVERTYEGSRDCPAIHQHLSVRHTLDSYLGQPGYAPHLWWMAKVGKEPAGCLILAEHSPALWELVYMGVAPEFRGRQLGAELARHALAKASNAGVKQLALAVDANNRPALRAYDQCGFEPFDQLAVFIRPLTPGDKL